MGVLYTYRFPKIKKISVYNETLISLTKNQLLIFWNTITKKIFFSYKTDKDYINLMIFNKKLYLQGSNCLDELPIDFEYPIFTENNSINNFSTIKPKKVSDIDNYSKLIIVKNYLLILGEQKAIVINEEGIIKNLKINKYGIYTDSIIYNENLYLTTDTGKILYIENITNQIESDCLKMQGLYDFEDVIVSFLYAYNYFYILFIDKILIKIDLASKERIEINTNQDNHFLRMNNDNIYLIGGSGDIDILDLDLEILNQLNFYDKVLDLIFVGERVFIHMKNEIIEYLGNINNYPMIDYTE